MREKALFQTILPGRNPEHVLIGAVAIAAVIERRLRLLVGSVGEVAVTEGGCGRMHAVVALSGPADGDAPKAIRAALGAVRLVKQVIAVDDDVDIHDPAAVEWAVCTRARAERDLLLLGGMGTSRSDPLNAGGVITKVGIDATRHSADRDDWRDARPAEAMLARARASLVRSRTAPR